MGNGGRVQVRRLTCGRHGMQFGAAVLFGVKLCLLQLFDLGNRCALVIGALLR